MLERFANILIFGFLLLKVKKNFDRRELAKEVVELLRTAIDGKKSLIDASDWLKLYVEISHLFGILGYQRKTAFFSRQVAQLYLQQEDCLSAISAMQVLAMTTKVHRVQCRSIIFKSLSNKEMRSSSVDIGKIHLNSVVALFESQ
ncbi:hypothetical protein GIB67_035639 [Kingdonia uniflora]|uniref:Trs120/TRAPPC9 TPR region domain-containing protein n=1 Tax=Kingdonia uniflora TaxID=39325 RepID=A0A7J7KUQ1_9MAGN|nr:hypothetical protein GIB67_035639 [Kingdonia uniflora]